MAGGQVTTGTRRPRSTPTRTRRPISFSQGTLAGPGAHWDAAVGEFILPWDEVIAARHPHRRGLDFARSAFQHACLVCAWDPKLAATIEGNPPPVK